MKIKKAKIKEELDEKRDLLKQCDEQIASFENLSQVRDELIFSLENEMKRLKRKNTA